MAKFKSSHLKLKTDQKVYFGDSDQAWFSYTTVSGRGINLTTNVPISGERAIEWHQLVRKDQLDAERRRRTDRTGGSCLAAGLTSVHQTAF